MPGIAAAPSPSEHQPLRVLVVDDDPVQRLLAGSVLQDARYEVRFADAAPAALELLRGEDFDLVLLDKRMPGMDGDEACRRIRGELGLSLLPVLMVTGSVGADELAHSLEAGADDFIGKPYLPVELLARVDAAGQRKRLTDQLDSAESLLFALARMVEAKDDNTGEHCSRLAHLGVELGRALGLSAPELLALRRGGVLHDIGKLGIPDRILTKPGALDAQEWQLMRRHPTIGADLVGGLRSMRLTAPIIRHHHERWDGSGYPDGLAGAQIPLLARVFQVVDVFDALAWARPYKPALPLAQALAVLADEAARGWRDPQVTAVFIELAQRSPQRLQVPAPAADELGGTLYRRVASPRRAECTPLPGAPDLR